MNSRRLYFIMIAVVCLLVVGFLGGAYGVNVVLQRQAQSVIDARSKSAALEQQQTQLVKAKASISKYQEIGAIAKSVVPQDKDQAQAVREIVKIAGDNAIKLGAISFPSSSLGAKAASGSSKTSSSSLSQLKAAAGISGVYTLQITIQSDTTSQTKYDQFIDFLAALERNRRTALVSDITVVPNADDPSIVSFTLTIDEYIKP